MNDIITPGPALNMRRPFFSVVRIFAPMLPRLLDFQEGNTWLLRMIRRWKWQQCRWQCVMTEVNGEVCTVKDLHKRLPNKLAAKAIFGDKLLNSFAFSTFQDWLCKSLRYFLLKREKHFFFWRERYFLPGRTRDQRKRWRLLAASGSNPELENVWLRTWLNHIIGVLYWCSIDLKSSPWQSWQKLSERKESETTERFSLRQFYLYYLFYLWDDAHSIFIIHFYIGDHIHFILGLAIVITGNIRFPRKKIFD